MLHRQAVLENLEAVRGVDEFLNNNAVLTDIAVSMGAVANGKIQ